MLKISKDGTKNYENMETLIEDYELSAKELLRLITDWHGEQLLNKDFMENLRDCEGFTELDYDDDDDEYEDEDDDGDSEDDDTDDEEDNF